MVFSIFVTFKVYSIMADEKNERRREHNWSPAEKDCLRESINCHINVVESKQNDMAMIKKKKDAWESIRVNMMASGFDREVPKMKQQWMRMKIGAKKAVAQVKRATVSSGNVVAIPTLDETDLQILSMITCDPHQEDAILIDSDTASTSSLLTTCSPLAQQSSQTPEEDTTLPTLPFRNESFLKRLQNFPKKSTGENDAIKGRMLHNTNESAQAEELYSLRIEQLRAEIAHQSRMHKRQEEQLEELHALKCKLIRIQIKQQEYITKP